MGIAEDDATGWHIQFTHYDPRDEGRREAVLALGNGCLVSRSAAPESPANSIHYPGTYRVGCYNELVSRIQGQDVRNESVVNLPNWLPLTFRIESGEWFALERATIQQYRQTLNLQHGLLTREVRFTDTHGRQTTLRERRFISMANPHMMALETELTPHNWSGGLEVRTGLDGRVSNSKVARYAPYESQHLENLHTAAWGENGLEITARTNQSAITVAIAARTRLQLNSTPLLQEGEVTAASDSIYSTFKLQVKEGETLRVEKIAALYSSMRRPSEECGPSARKAVAHASDFGRLLSAHQTAWERLWEQCQLKMEQEEQLLYFRLHIYHILQNFSPHTVEMDVGVPPSGWQGEEYHGQVFWDEIFVFPFLTFHFPESARALLLYRYRRLRAARQLASRSGYKGAMFPWRSASDGGEETPPLQLNPLSGRWTEDYTYLQRHIGAGIAYNICYYVHTTGDQRFLAEYGAELLIEIARFWASISTYSEELDKYEIFGVAGPDEYHTVYPGAEEHGLRNNTYTNVMAAWTLSKARLVLEGLSFEVQTALREKLQLQEEELELWATISRKMRVIFQADGTLCQFEGFERLQKFDLEKFREQHGTVRLDWTLEAQGDSVQRYQVAKQADTPLLLYLFSPEKLISVFAQLGYTLTRETLIRTLQNHQSHTAHESTLSKIVFAGAFAAFDPAESWKFFEQAQQVDMSPSDTGAAEGIHLGAMGGSLAVLQRHYLQGHVQEGRYTINPSLPEALGGVQFLVSFRGEKLWCEAKAASGTVYPVR